MDLLFHILINFVNNVITNILKYILNREKKNYFKYNLYLTVTHGPP